MSVKNVGTRIDEVFGSDPDEALLNQFLQRLQAVHDDTERAIVRRVLSFVLTWIILYGISVGFIEGGSIESFSIKNLTPLLAIGPILMAIQYYLLSIGFSSSMLLESAIRATYGKILPESVSQGLHTLTYAQTFANVEGILSEFKAKGLVALFHVVTSHVMAASMVLSVFFALGHVSYLLVSADAVPWYVSSPSIFIAAVIGLKGLLLQFSLSGYS